MSSDPPNAPDCPRARLDVLRRAIELYLGIAYPDGAAVPEAVRRRLEWDGSPEAEADPDATLCRPPFEKVGKTPDGETIVALRLGNVRYPHMKLQVQPWTSSCGVLLSVNTHDQALSLDPNSSDAPAFRAIQAENQRIKEAIESAWDAAGLPTFHRYLRDYIANHAGPA